MKDSLFWFYKESGRLVSKFSSLDSYVITIYPANYHQGNTSHLFMHFQTLGLDVFDGVWSAPNGECQRYLLAGNSLLQQKAMTVGMLLGFDNVYTSTSVKLI